MSWFEEFEDWCDEQCDTIQMMPLEDRLKLYKWYSDPKWSWIAQRIIRNIEREGKGGQNGDFEAAH